MKVTYNNQQGWQREWDILIGVTYGAATVESLVLDLKMIFTPCYHSTLF